MTEPQDAVVQALQRVLAAQHAAVYGYPVIGVRLRNTGQIRLARELEAGYRHTRDELMAQLAARRVTPVPAEASYRAAQPVAKAADAQRWALELEEDCAGGYRYLLVAPVLAVTRGTSPSATEQTGLRRQALTGLTTAASNATRWRLLLNPNAPTTPFPGL